MRSVRWRDSLAWGLATTLLLGLLATFRLALDIGHPFGGFIEEYLPSAGDRLQIDSNTPPAWPNMAAYDLLSDGLVALNGEPYRPNQAAHYAEAFSRPERTIVLTIERAGELMELSLPIRVFSLTDYLDIKFPIIVTNISLWLLAAIVYSGQPSDPLNRAAAWLFNILALALWTPFVSVFWNDEPLVWLINAATNFAWPMLGAAIINFAWHFPRPLARGPRWLPDLAQALGLTLGVLWAGCRLWIYVFGWSPAIAELDGWAFRASLSGLLVVGLVFFVGRLVWSWRVERDRAVVRGLGIVTIGLVLASPPILLFLIDMTGNQMAIILEGLDLRYLLLAIPASYAFVILRYRTFRLAHPMFLLVVVIAMSALATSFGAWLARLFLGLPPRSLSESFLPAFFVALAVSTFWATQTAWQGLFGRLLQWERGSLAAARNFGDRLSTRLDPDGLPHLMCSTLQAELKLHQVGIWRWTGSELTPAGWAGDWPAQPPPLMPDRAALADESFGVRRPVRLHLLSPSVPQWLWPLAQTGAEVVVFLGVPDERLGVLALGRKWDEEVFDERDLEIVGLIAHQASSAWLAGVQMDELRRVPLLLSEAQKRERFRIAQDLHDTVQQRLGGLQLLLDAAAGALGTTTAQQARDLLARCMVETERTAQMVARIRDHLAPPEGERRLETVIHAATEDFLRRTGVAVDLSVQPGVGRRIPQEAQHEIGLIVQQALDNIAEHAAATRVTLVVETSPERLHFWVIDDGRGFAETRPQMAQATGSFGVRSMRARALNLGGQLHIESALGQGTRVEGWIPLARPVSD
ncbi:MAG TPA: histidine kinase [Anaerolineales bacterium]|nr:histidine kinase [Anaerolineales bacterium]